DSAGLLAPARADFRVITAAEQVLLGKRHFADDAVRRRIAAGDGELAGGLVLNINKNNNPVRRRAGLGRNADRFEEAQAVQPAFGAVDEGVIVGVAFGDIEFAANDVIARARIAADV